MRDIKTSALEAVKISDLATKRDSRSHTAIANKLQELQTYSQNALIPFLIKCIKGMVKSILRRGIMPDKDASLVVTSLDKILREYDQNIFSVSREDGSAILAIHARLKVLAGDSANMINAYFSTAEQQSAAVRMWIKDAIDSIQHSIHGLVTVAADKAEEHNKTVIPGERCQSVSAPTSLGYSMISLATSMIDNSARLNEICARVYRSPIGAYQGAGSSLDFGIKSLAKNLGFSEVLPNGMMALNDNTFMQEFVFAVNTIAAQVSKTLDMFLNWQSPSNGYVIIPHAFLSKDEMLGIARFPTAIEAASSRASAVIGDLEKVMSILHKADSISLFDNIGELFFCLVNSFSTVMNSMEIATKLLSSFEVDRRKLKEAAKHPYGQSADLLHYLTRKLEIPYERASKITIDIIKYAIDNGKKLSLLELEELQSIEPKINSDIYSVLIVSRALVSRRISCGTSPVQLRKMIRAIKRKFLKSIGSVEVVEDIAASA